MTEIEAVEALLDNMRHLKRLAESIELFGAAKLSDEDKRWLKNNKPCFNEECNSVERFALYLEETSSELRTIEITPDYLEDMVLSMQINVLKFYQEMKGCV